MQWGTGNGTGNGYEQQIGSFNFPRSFTTYYTMVVSVVNTATSNENAKDVDYQVRNVTKSSFTLYQQRFGDGSFEKFNWIAIGVS